MAEKKIRISADTSGMEGGFNRAGRAASDSFGRASEAAENIGRAMDDSIEDSKSKFEELSIVTSELFDGLVQDSEKGNRSFKERAKFILEEINLIRLAAREETQLARLRAKERYEEAKKKFSGPEAGNKEKLAEAKENYMDEMADINSRSEMSDLQNTMLRNKLARAGAGALITAASGQESDPLGMSTEVLDKPRQTFNAAAAAAGFGAILSVTGFVGKLFGEGGELDQAVNNAAASGATATGGIQGMKTADVLRYNIQTARELGYGGVAGANEAQKQGRMEQAMGMDLGSVSAFNQAFRSEENNKTLSDSMKEMVSIMQKTGLYGIDKGDFTMMHELLEKQNQLNTLQASSLEQINSTSSNQVLATFAKAGGSFSDQRAVGTISQINRSITDPDNDFKKAFVMRSIRNRMSGASLLDIKEMQEKGVFGQGVIHGIMEDISKISQGDERIFNIKSLFGGSVQQSKALAELYDKDPEALKQIGSLQELAVDEKTERRITTGGVGQLEQAQATFNDMFAKAGKGVIDVLMPQVQKYLNAFDKDGITGIFSQFGEDMKFIFKEGAEMMKEAVWGETNSLKKGLSGTQVERKVFAETMKTNPQTMGVGYLLDMFNTGPDKPKKEEKQEKTVIQNKSSSIDMEETNSYLREMNDVMKANKSIMKSYRNKNYATA